MLVWHEAGPTNQRAKRRFTTTKSNVYFGVDLKAKRERERETRKKDKMIRKKKLCNILEYL